MSPIQHTVISTIISGIFYSATHSVEGTAICFLSGIFIDIDHYFDLWICKRKILLQPRYLFSFCEREKDGKLHLIFHSFEFFFILWISIFFFKLNLLWWGLAIGTTIHIILDQIYNPVQPFTYFLTYRAKHRFEKKAMYGTEEYRNLK